MALRDEGPEAEDPVGAIGTIGFGLSHHGAAFGYAMGRAWWGRGLMAEALAALADRLIAERIVRRVSAFCDVENHASARVMEKAGFSFEGRLRRYDDRWDDAPRDCLMYARTTDDLAP